ncbi:hypothetical protein FQN57_000589 [Myotisia sp. PD_48]|nr:hypothetical protein FQN57_000589 [Myotisia sp. PD_48]
MSWRLLGSHVQKFPVSRIFFHRRLLHGTSSFATNHFIKDKKFTISVTGPRKENDADHKSKLLSQLKLIPKHAQSLTITDDTPSDAEWGLLGEHFHAVKTLEAYAGFNEELNDGKIPLHWPARGTKNQVNLETLELLENDALDTLDRIALGLRYLLGVKTLNLCSTNRCDFRLTSDLIFPQVLPQLRQTDTLKFTNGETTFHKKEILPNLYKSLPPNISTLRFRGPVSLACNTSTGENTNSQWEEWVSSFANPEFLPNLKHLSFILDLEAAGRGSSPTTDGDRLKKAQQECSRIYAAARSRGVTVEPFIEEWLNHDCAVHFHPVDQSWNLCL